VASAWLFKSSKRLAATVIVATVPPVPSVPLAVTVTFWLAVIDANCTVAPVIVLAATSN
jgi:hypothetical protein